MSQPFKFRFVREIVGTFVLATLALLVATILYAGRAQGWFDEELRFRLLLPEGVATGIGKGSEVLLSGHLVGAVTAIRLSDEDRMEAEVRVRGELLRFLREDSTATIRKKFGVVGAYVYLSRGSGAPLPGGATLKASVDDDLNVLAANTLREITESIRYTMYQVNALLRAYTELAENLEDPVLELEAILRNVNDITDGLQKGEGTTGQFLKDPELAAEIRRTLVGLRGAVESLEPVLTDVKAASAQFPDISAAVPDAMEQLRSMTAEVQRLVEGLQRHWLVRRYVDENEGERIRLDPAEIDAGEGGGL